MKVKNKDKYDLLNELACFYLKLLWKLISRQITDYRVRIHLQLN